MMRPLYLLLLFAVETHGGIGLYRLALKWGWLEGRDPSASRRRLRIAKPVHQQSLLLDTPCQSDVVAVR